MQQESAAFGAVEKRHIHKKWMPKGEENDIRSIYQKEKKKMHKIDLRLPPLFGMPMPTKPLLHWRTHGNMCTEEL